MPYGAATLRKLLWQNNHLARFPTDHRCEDSLSIWFGQRPRSSLPQSLFPLSCTAWRISWLYRIFSCTMTLTSPWCLQWQANRKRMRNEVLGLQLPWWPHLSEKNSSMAFLAWLLSSCFSRCCKHSSKMDSSRPLRIRRGIDKDRIRTYRNNFNNHNSSERPEVITIPVNFPPIESSSSSKRKTKNN